MALLAALCGSRSEALWFTQEHLHSLPCAESVVDQYTQLIECFMSDFGVVVEKHMRVVNSDSVTARGNSETTVELGVAWGDSIDSVICDLDC